MKDLIDRNDLLKAITAYNGVIDKSVAKRIIIQTPNNKGNKMKHQNVINIQLKLWELVHPNIKLSITEFPNDGILVTMSQGLYIRTIHIHNLQWDYKSPDSAYNFLVTELNKLYEELIISMKGDKNWQDMLMLRK